MTTEGVQSRRSRVPAILAVMAVLAVVVVAVRARYPDGIPFAFAQEDTGNYKILYPDPAGWVEKPHSPFSLFLYEHPKTKTLIRGSLNHVVADFNPTPELDTDGIAQHNLQTTKDNMPGWTGKRIDDIEAKGGRFSAIWRERNDRTVVTAFLAKGNTTVIVSISGHGDAKAEVPALMQVFRTFVAAIDLEPTTID